MICSFLDDSRISGVDKECVKVKQRVCKNFEAHSLEKNGMTRSTWSFRGELG
jgi:hypothetical protein